MRPKMTRSSVCTSARKPESISRTGPRATSPAPGGPRFGYAAGALVDVLLLLAVNAWPGWEAVPFLTGEAVAFRLQCHLDPGKEARP